MSPMLADFTWGEFAIGVTVAFLVYVALPCTILFFVVRPLTKLLAIRPPDLQQPK